MDTLLGQIIDTLKKPEKGGDLYCAGQEEQVAFARKIGIKMRDDILMAKRYHLSSDFAKNATIYVYNVDNPIEDVLKKARVPFDSIWLEWSMSEKEKVFGLNKRFYKEENGSKFAGVLIKRINGSPSHFTITAITCAGKKGSSEKFVDWSPVSIEVNIEKPYESEERIAQLEYLKYSVLTLVKDKEIPESYTEESFTYAFLRAALLGGRDELEILEAHEKIIDIADYGIHRLTPFYGNIYHNSIMSRSISDRFRHTLVSAMGGAISEQAGLFRYIVSCLALLNETQYIRVDPIKPGKSRPDSLVKPKPQPIYNFVTMTAPHNVFIREKQGENEIKRERMRHEVTGSWVNYHKTGKEDCEHAFANMDETGNRKICLLCGRRKTWRREHERGNAELGFKPRQARIVLDN